MMAARTRPGRRGERGSILILSTVGLVVAIISAALAIDLGFLAHEIRVDQKVADLAALDAARALPADPTPAAQASALRNGFPYLDPGYGLAVKWAPNKNGPWSSNPADLAGASVVQVAATSPHQNFFPFVPGGQSKTRTAVAGSLPEAAFSVGSTLAAIDTQKSVLDPMLGGMLGVSSASMSAVSYSGLATGNVSLSALQTNLLAMGYDVGTTDKLLANNVKVADLLRASALALAANGNAAAAAEVNDIPLTSIPNLKVVTLGDLVGLSQPGSNSALDTTLNVFQLLTGSAQVANGNNFVNVPGITVNVPGVGTVGFKLKVIEPAQTARGPVGVYAQTSQVTLRLSISLLPLVFLGPTIALDVDFNAARGKGTLTAIECGAAPSITVGVTTAATTVTGSGVVPLLGTLNVTGALAAGAGGSLGFDYPTEFAPPLGADLDGQRVSAATLNLSAATVDVTGTGLAAATAATVEGLLPTILTTVDLVATPLLQPVLRALGADVAAADVSALGIYPPPPACGGAILVK